MKYPVIVFSSSSKSVIFDENTDFDAKADDEVPAAFDSDADNQGAKAGYYLLFGLAPDTEKLLLSVYELFSAPYLCRNTEILL